MQVIGRKAAMQAGLSLYFTGRPCKHGHLELRHVTKGTCRGCVREAKARSYRSDSSRLLATHKRWRERNPDYAAMNSARIAANKKRFALNNPGIGSLYRAQRRAKQRRATPPWFAEIDRFLLSEAYDLARLRKQSTGFAWDVDHIVPLAGRNVCGLHAAGNIQVIPQRINRRKSNTFVLQ